MVKSYFELHLCFKVSELTDQSLKGFILPFDVCCSCFLAVIFDVDTDLLRCVMVLDFVVCENAETFDLDPINVDWLRFLLSGVFSR